MTDKSVDLKSVHATPARLVARVDSPAQLQIRQKPFCGQSILRLLMLCSILAIRLFAGSADAQSYLTGEKHGPVAEMPRSKSPGLPDAPARALLVTSKDAAVTTTPQTEAGSRPTLARTVLTGHLDNLIDPQEIAPELSTRDKVGMGLKASVSPFAIIGWVGSATYSETFNRSPNYGQSAEEYAERVAAAAARASSESIFSTSVMAPIFHEDPRYFVEGPGQSGFHRAIYAVSRVLITRTDDGRTKANYALLTGNAIGAGLTQTYYPAGNRNLHGTATTFGVSLAGSGVKFLLDEFFYKEASIAQLRGKLKPVN